MKFSFIIFILFSTTLATTLFAQPFEGLMKIHVRNDSIEKWYELTIKDHKTMLVSHEDSSEVVTLITDRNLESTIMLKSKGNMKYGFQIQSIPGSSGHVMNGVEGKDYVVEKNAIQKSTGENTCSELTFKNSTGIANATIINDHTMTLSNYFPSFTGTDMDPQLLILREAADSRGFVKSYWEKNTATGQEKSIEVILEPAQINIEAFNPNPAYLVLTRNSLELLYNEAQYSPEKKKQIEEFRYLFGKN